MTKQIVSKRRQKVVASRALAKGLKLLEILSAAQAPLMLGELSELIGLGKPSTYRLLTTLVDSGFALKNEAGNYEAGRRMIEQVAEDLAVRLIRASREAMEQLNADLAETVSLAALFEDHIRVVHTIESPRHVRMSNYPGRILAPNASSLGKAIAAYQSPQKLQSLVQVYGMYQTTPNTITDPVGIREEMARTRERGFSSEFEETVLEGCCFGAPILERGGVVRAAISVSLPKSRLTDAMQKIIPDRIQDTARRIAKRLEEGAE
jgi:IclR family acetate operon transcriptional repressor